MSEIKICLLIGSDKQTPTIQAYRICWLHLQSRHLLLYKWKYRNIQNILYKFTILENRVLLGHYTYVPSHVPRHTNFCLCWKNFFFLNFPQTVYRTPSHSPELNGGGFASTSKGHSSAIFPPSHWRNQKQRHLRGVRRLNVPVEIEPPSPQHTHRTVISYDYFCLQKQT